MLLFHCAQVLYTSGMVMEESMFETLNQMPLGLKLTLIAIVLAVGGVTGYMIWARQTGAL